MNPIGQPDDEYDEYQDSVRGPFMYESCPVCKRDEPLEDYDICARCGFEACLDEDMPGGIEGYRILWVSRGSPWFQEPTK